MHTIPRFQKMSGRYRRLHGNMLKKMALNVRAAPEDCPPKEIRPMNINYEKLLGGYEKLGHMKKLSVPFDMGKSKSRDMSMMMQTEAYKNILYENYRLQCEERFSSEKSALNISLHKKRSLNNKRA